MVSDNPWLTLCLYFCLWNIQLTFDWDGIETSGAYHHKSELCKRVHEFLKSDVFCGSYRKFRTGKVNARMQNVYMRQVVLLKSVTLTVVE